MKIVKYEEDGEKEEKIIRLKLVQKGDIVELIAVDDLGHREHRGSLLQIRPEGKICTCKWVGERLGFQLDEDGGHIITEKE